MTMKIHKFLVNVLILITFCTCTVSTDYTSALKHAEDCMNDQPENALTALQNIPYPEQLSNQQYALWCLLITQAQDKCYITHDTDSLINIAVRYFDKGDNSYRKAQAYYCQGRVYTDMLLFDKAIVGYLKAEELVQYTTNNDLHAHICNHLGDLYRKNSLLDKSLAYYQKAYSCYELDGFSKGMAYTLRDIGIAYEYIGEMDSSIIYLNKSLDYAKENDWNDLNVSVLNCLGSTYISMELYPVAINYISAAISMIEDRELLYSSYYTLASLYKEVGKKDSALLYFDKSINSLDLFVRCQSYKEYSFLLNQEKHYPLAIQYLEQYIMLRDSIEHVFQPVKAKEIDARYNYERLENEKNKLLLSKKENEFVFLLVVISLLILSFILVLLYKDRLRKKQLELKLKEKDLLVNQHHLLEVQNEIKENKASLIQKDRDIELKVTELHQYMDLVQKMEENRIQLESSYSQKTEKLNKDIAFLSNEIVDNRASLALKDKELYLKIEELKEYIAMNQSLEGEKQRMVVTFSQRSEELNSEISNLQKEILEQNILLTQKDTMLHQKMDELQKYIATTQNMKDEKLLLENTYSQKIEELNKEIAILQGEIKEKNLSVLKIKKKSNEFVQRYLEVNYSYFKKLYDKNEVVTAFSDDRWNIFERYFNNIYPDFIPTLNKVCPNMSKKEQRYCCMLILGIKTSKISAVLDLEPNTVSKYRKGILDKYFARYNGLSLNDVLNNML